MSILLILALTLPAQDSPSPSRALSMDLCAIPRLAGTAGSERAARWVSAKLNAAGWDVGIETRGALLSLPRSIDFSASAAGSELFRRRDRFDANAVPLATSRSTTLGPRAESQKVVSSTSAEACAPISKRSLPRMSN